VTTADSGRSPRDLRSGAVLLGGSLLYAGLEGWAGLTFNATPLFIGVVAMAAGLGGRRRRLVPVGMTLVGWGAAVLLVRDGPLPANREAAAFLVGMAVGLLAASVVARRWHLPITGALLTGLSGGLAFYLAYDIAAVGEWPLWAFLVAAWGAFELVRPQEVEPD